MSVYKRIFLDTNPIIYFLEKQNENANTVRKFLTIATENESEFYTSTITDAEFLVYPYMENNQESIEAYYDFIRNLHVLKCFVTEDIAEKSAQIRAKYPSIKLGDSIQLAASIDCGCDCFYTNDSQLKQVTEVNVVYLGDIE